MHLYTDTSKFVALQVCEVQVEVRGGGAARSAQRHVVAAALTPEGGRTYKVDERIKTGKEVGGGLAGKPYTYYVKLELQHDALAATLCPMHRRLPAHLPARAAQSRRH